MKTKPRKTKSLGNFNYASLQSLMVFFSVPLSRVRPLLKGTGLEPGVFDGQALVNLNFERYSSFGSNYTSYVDEVEFNVVVLPRFRAGTEPELTAQQFINGEDQSKTYGNFRINVPCDSAIAVQAGSQKYGEIKFVASFDFIVPDVNDLTVPTWWIRCYSTSTPPKSQVPYIFDLKVNTNVAGAPAASLSPFSPVPAYANLLVKKEKHLVTSARVVFGLFKSWIPAPVPTPPTPLPSGMVALTVGDAKHAMTQQMATVFAGNPPAVGVLLFESLPAASSAHTLMNQPVR